MALARPRSRGGARDSKGKAALPVPAGGHARDVPRAALRGGDDHRAFRAFVVVRHRRRRLEPDADSVRVFPVAHVFPSGRGRRRGLRFLRDAPGGERRFPVLRRAGRGRDARRARGVSRRAMGAVFGVVGHGRVRVRGRRPVRVGGRPNPPRARERRDPPPVGRAHDPVHLGQARGYRSRPPLDRRGALVAADKPRFVRDRVQRAPRGGPRLDGGLPREAGQRAVRARGGRAPAAPVRGARSDLRRRRLQRAEDAAAPASAHRRRRRDLAGVRAGRRGEGRGEDDDRKDARDVGVGTSRKGKGFFDDEEGFLSVGLFRFFFASANPRRRRRREPARRVLRPRIFRRRASPRLGGRLRRARRGQPPRALRVSGQGRALRRAPRHHLARLARPRLGVHDLVHDGETREAPLAADVFRPRRGRRLRRRKAFLRDRDLGTRRAFRAASPAGSGRGAPRIFSRRRVRRVRRRRGVVFEPAQTRARRGRPPAAHRPRVRRARRRRARLVAGRRADPRARRSRARRRRLRQRGRARARRVAVRVRVRERGDARGNGAVRRRGRGRRR